MVNRWIVYIGGVELLLVLFILDLFITLCYRAHGG
jgi:hypothetical protein